MPRVKKADRCEWPDCRDKWTIEATLARESGADESKMKVCEPHADAFVQAFTPQADKVDSWDLDGNHTELLSREAAVVRLQITEGLSRREARRKLERMRGL